MWSSTRGKSAEDWAADGSKYSAKEDHKMAALCYFNAATLWAERAREIRNTQLNNIASYSLAKTTQDTSTFKRP